MAKKWASTLGGHPLVQFVPTPGPKNEKSIAIVYLAVTPQYEKASVTMQAKQFDPATI